ncbi:sulfide/dihydroorotate dehydrogenase-like FAD/NAD-binding protein [Clostridium magnum]|uniref:Dihydroorotate dehydrogenase B (NAD(+)), electron transfer subunit n=1 Tax=Clostridium magnum DSM 2767 TaxID=1121326 RepID=A0A162QNY8_9CLOT|nr:sulfide/dihydroorotate dehydrogenase-like FAD/NAD-binding protein [Clostridium magnum]KZL88769.1 dihydroorotate dehydrogenase B (NAD(+)), electron transfer subunit [Clostridium magnum DSM 2767]SHJ51061.1 sulfide dehydrogenase (flavoprotein) subunit SudB [Clostridium magnum DSM 2767]
MYKILNKKELVPNVFLIEVQAPRIAKSCLPGQFAIVKVDEKAERIPLAISDYDAKKGTVTIVFQVLGASTQKIANYNVGQSFKDFVGPLGQSSILMSEDLEKLKNKKMLFIGGGPGTAAIYPQVKWLNENRVNVDVIIGGKSKQYLVLEEELKEISANLYIATDDGSYGYKGFTTDLLIELIEKERKKYDQVVAIGSMNMMRSISEVTKSFGIKTTVSLKSIMVDGVGLCGGCRVTVGGETKFACLDGPEFDGHLVDFEEAIRRQSMYKTEEGKNFIEKQEKEEGHICHVGL